MASTGSPERPAIRLIHPEFSYIAFYFEHNRISKILRLDQSKRAKSVVGKSRPRTCENCTTFCVLVPRLPSSSFLFPFPYGLAALAALPRHLRSWIGQHARFEPGEAASHTAVRRHARLPARPPLCLRVGSEVRQPHEPHQPRRRPERRRTARAPGHRQATHLPALHRASCISPVALPCCRAFRPPPVSPALARQSHALKHKRERDRCGDAAVPPEAPTRRARPPVRPASCAVCHAPCVCVCVRLCCARVRVGVLWGCGPAACCSLFLLTSRAAASSRRAAQRATGRVGRPFDAAPPDLNRGAGLVPGTQVAGGGRAWRQAETGYA